MSLVPHFTSFSDHALVKWLVKNTSFSPVIVVLLTISAFAWSLRVFYFKKQKGMSPPGPIGFPLLGNLPFLKPDLHVYFATLAREYGPVVKVMLGSKAAIVLTSPSAFREILKDQDAIFAYRDVPIGGRAIFEGRQMVWTQYGPEWRMLRKASSLKMLGNSAVDMAYGIRRKEFRNTVWYLYRQAGSPVNVGDQMLITALNVITNMIWGGTVQGEDRDILSAKFNHAISEMTTIMGKPNVSDFFPSLARFDLQGIGKRTNELGKQFDRIFDSVIDQRLRMEKDGRAEAAATADTNEGEERGREDFLQFLLKLKDDEKDNSTSLTMVGLKGLLMSMVVGGTETSARTVEFVMSELINNPPILAKARQELDIVVGKNNIVEDVHIGKLLYLHAVVKESLRLHPPVPLLIPHRPIQDTIVSGFAIRKNSRIFFNVWAIHHDPTLWENPNEFVPERFLTGSLSRDYSGNDFTYLPFGSGRRICPGLLMAERMVMYALATLIHSFDWKLPDGEKKVDLSERLFGLVLEKKVPLIVIPMPRLSDPALYE